MQASRPEILKTPIGDNEIHLHHSRDHHADWLNAIRTRGPTVAPVDAGHRTAALCHLTNIACLLGRKTTWDPDAERFIDDDEANRLAARPMREPWRL